MSRYHIEEYNPDWVTKFESIKTILGSVFGVRALAIEHVGSTSIPGMKAKPIIDVLVVVGDMTLLSKEKDVMQTKGYLVQEDYVLPNTLLFRRIDGEGNKIENIHVCESSSPMEKQFLVMRDYLRAFPDECRRYSDLKVELLKKFPNDYESYRATKDPFLKDLKQKAYLWHATISRAS